MLGSWARLEVVLGDGSDSAGGFVVVFVAGVPGSSSTAAARTAARAGLAKFHETYPGKGRAVVLDGGEDNNVD